MDFFQYLGRAVCHQVPDRCFVVGDLVSPLCIRCLGVYLGIFAGLCFLAILRRARTRTLPRLPVLALALLFFSFAGIDIFLIGFGYVETRAWVRLLTGYWSGLAGVILCLPVFNTRLWAAPAETRSPFTVATVAGLLAAGVPVTAAAILAGNSAAGLLLLAGLTSLLVIATFVFIIAVIVHALRRSLRPAAPAWPAFLIAGALFVLEIVAINWLKQRAGY